MNTFLAYFCQNIAADLGLRLAHYGRPALHQEELLHRQRLVVVADEDHVVVPELEVPRAQLHLGAGLQVPHGGGGDVGLRLVDDGNCCRPQGGCCCSCC